MHIVIAHTSTIPVAQYGGTERVIWYLGSELAKLGHKVTFLTGPGSSSSFAKVKILQPDMALGPQLPADADLVHCHYLPPDLDALPKPYVFTLHGNINNKRPLPLNTVFVSRNHAARSGSTSYVYNGMDWDDYGKPDLQQPRNYFHFLAKAAWRVKNVQGAIDVIRKTPHERLHVLGGKRFNVSMGLRLTLSPRISFYGMVGGREKLTQLNGSKGLLFPVKWHEPFGLAITESLYFGCPVFGTPYGSLPELVSKETGFLTNDANEMAIAIVQSEQYNKQHCHQYASDVFNSKKMAEDYLLKYAEVLQGRSLNNEAPVLKQIQTEKFLPWS